MVAVCTLLRRPEVRLLTLLDTGGIGKTRLSLQVAMEMRETFADGVCFIQCLILYGNMVKYVLQYKYV